MAKQNYYRFTGVSASTKLPVNHYEHGAKIARGHIVAMTEDRFNNGSLRDRFELVGPVEDSVPRPAVEEDREVDLAAMSAVDAANFINSLQSIQAVTEFAQAEKSGKARKTVLAAADSRLLELASGS